MTDSDKNTSLLKPVVDYYSSKIEQFGPVPRGVDWNSEESQNLRFEPMADFISSQPAVNSMPVTLLDYGCGYGAFFSYLKKNKPGFSFKGTGFDLSLPMVAAARQKDSESNWTESLPAENFDFVVASGVFNVRLDRNNADWQCYVFDQLDLLNEKATRGFAFNLLSTYSDVEKRAEHLYFADPKVIFDRCKLSYSRFVTLKHDYPLYEFTILVKKS